MKPSMSVSESGSAGADETEYVGIVVGLGREHRCRQLCLVTIAVRKQRPQRSVDKARGENLLVAQPCFPFEEAPGNPARGVGFLDVVHREREEVDSLPRLVRVDGDENRRVSVADDHAAVRLLRQPARLDREGFPAEFKLHVIHLRSYFRIACAGLVPAPCLLCWNEMWVGAGRDAE
jgi:hypothetical protein